MRIDAHLHINLHGYSLKHIIRYLNNNGLDCCWLLSWEDFAPAIPSMHYNLHIEDIMEAFAKYPDRIIPFYAPDPKRSDLHEQFHKSGKSGIKGCGELKVSHRWESDYLENYLSQLNHKNLPLLFHMENERNIYFPPKDSLPFRKFGELLNGALNGISKEIILKMNNYVKPIQSHIEKHSVYFPGYLLDFASLENRLQEYPDINFIAHGPHFWNHISARVNPYRTHGKGRIKEPGIIDTLLEKYDNLYCDISGKSGFHGLSRDKKYTKYLLDKHYRKILFGTDNRKLGIAQLVHQCKLPTYKQKRIFGLNALELIKS